MTMENEITVAKFDLSGEIETIIGVNIDISKSADCKIIHSLFTFDFSNIEDPNAKLIGIHIHTTDDSYILKCLSILVMINQLWNIKDNNDISPFDNIFEIIMPCGNKVSYKHLTDIPFETVPCNCGNSNHHFIKYTSDSPLP